MNIGIDFGSTYTTFSCFDATDDQVDPIIMTEGGSPFVRSVVSFDARGTADVGSNAKRKVGRKNTECYQAFKMLLPESDEALLRARGYTAERTPRAVAEVFLAKNLEKIRKRFAVSAFDRLVICAPEVWGGNASTLDGRTILRDICTSINGKDTVQVVSEPAAASAYFAYLYQKKEDKPFEGNVLVIDYGGGTLDITLTSIYTTEDDSNSVEIKVLGHTGAGENTEGQIGKAGIAYMESVARRSILAEMPDLEEVPLDNDFIKAVDSLEMDIQEKSDYIEDKFSEFADDLERIVQDDEIFCDMVYRDEEIPVSYAQLYEAYMETIHPVLKEQLDYIVTEYITPQGLSWTDSGERNLKIALVGGFGRFDLVKRQVDDFFNIALADEKLDKLGAGRKESAISLGAALLAEGKITLRDTSPISIGIYSMDQNGQGEVCCAIQQRQDIEFGKIYYVQENGEPVRYGNTQGTVENFAIGDRTKGAPYRIKKSMRDRIDAAMRRLSNAYPGCVHMYGFSMDSSDVITFHVLACDYEGEQLGEDHIELTSFKDVCEITRLRKEYDWCI